MKRLILILVAIAALSLHVDEEVLFEGYRPGIKAFIKTASLIPLVSWMMFTAAGLLFLMGYGKRKQGEGKL